MKFVKGVFVSVVALSALTACFGGDEKELQTGFKDYSEEELKDLNSDQRVLLFFTGDNCSECNRLEQTLIEQPDRIPEGVLVLKAHLDVNRETAEQYGIEYRNSFILLDDEGGEIKRWSGGGFDELERQVN